MTYPCCSHWDGCAIITETALLVVCLDGYPVAPGHALIIPRRHVTSLADLNVSEWMGMRDALHAAYRWTPAPAYTVGINDGEAAGRSVHHLHVHVIPRHADDVRDPRGGVRQVITGGASNDPLFQEKKCGPS